MKKHFMREKSISKHGENFHEKALTTECSDCGQLNKIDYPPY